jgi:anhydro-N-acetylmuramic acid kinase
MPLTQINQKNTIYIGAMSGTSVDKQVDFTAAVFADDGQLLCKQNIGVDIPASIRASLYHLSVTPCDQLTVAERTNGEVAITDFMIEAYKNVIEKLGLKNHPKETVILSPHGQTIDHQPGRQHTDQLLHGERLAAETGYPVAFRHRQACITCSDAAPLAPVLLQELLRPGLLRRDAPRKDGEKSDAPGKGGFRESRDIVVINGGGIANICIFSGDKTIAFDTGPANGPLDELIQHITQTDKTAIPTDLAESIITNGYDMNGQWAKRGIIDTDMHQALMTHDYFANHSTRKSADRTWFNLAWVLEAKGSASWQNTVTTLAAVIADSIAHAILLNSSTTDIELGFYGGLRYNEYVIQRILQQLKDKTVIQIDWNERGLDPDFIESLLMAYLGFCVHRNRAVDLNYCSTGLLRCARNDGRVIPGTLINAGVRHD